MSIEVSAISSARPVQVEPFLTRLARFGNSLGSPPRQPELPVPRNDAAPLTAAMLRAALLEIGVGTGAGNMALADAFAKLGLPLTGASVTEAHIALARAPGASPLSFALAKSLDLPATPDILRALTTVTDGIPAQRALPAEIMDWLSLALDMELEPEALAAHLHLMVNQRAQSTEGRLLAAGTRGADLVHDTRSLLLRMAQSSGDKQVQLGSGALASHIEGQQLINLAAHRDGADPHLVPFYFALPLQLPGEQTMLEMRCQHDHPEDHDWEDGTPPWQATVRLTTTRLGRMEAELSGTAEGSTLTCRIGAEQPGTVRLIQRSREKLSASLTALGWLSCLVDCRTKTDWPPLWHGGEALTAPRTRVDRQA